MVRNIEPEKSTAVQVPMQFTQPTLSVLDRMLETVIRERAAVVALDFSKVSQVDSAALNWLLALQDKVHANEGRVQINNPSDLMHDALLATRLETRFPIEVTTRREGGK